VTRRSLSPLFTWRTAVKDSDLPSSAKHVALNLSLYMSEAGTSAFPGLRAQAADCSLGKDTVIKALRLLEEQGWLRRTAIGGGRGHRAQYEATVPETVEQADRFAAAAAGSESSPGASGAPLAHRPSRPTADPPEQLETVERADRFGRGKQSISAAETVDLSRGNGRSVGTESVRTTSSTTAAAAASELVALLGDAAAAQLEQDLRDLKAGSRLRELAFANPQLAIEWIQVAKLEAARPAGFVLRGLESGLAPSPRDDAFRTAASTRRWISEVSWRLDSEHAHELLDERCSKLLIDGDELQALHELVDEARAEHAEEERAA